MRYNYSFIWVITYDSITLFTVFERIKYVRIYIWKEKEIHQTRLQRYGIVPILTIEIQKGKKIRL